MGSSITEERGLYAALNNCAFVSTEHLSNEPSKPFVFLMDASMLGYAKRHSLFFYFLLKLIFDL